MEITAHEQPVNFYGSSQVGYIILDPATGAGAYKIGGGENGGYFEYLNDNANKIVAALGIISILSVGAGAAVIFMVALTTLGVAFLLLMASDLRFIGAGCPEDLRLFNAFLTVFNVLLGLFLKGIGSQIVNAIAGFIYTSIAPSVVGLCRYGR